MALAATGVWETRPDGSVGQSGFFNPALGGTDYSQQAAAQLVVNDAVSTSTTTITSASGLFTAPMVGNGIILQGDGEYEIRAVVSATQITVDRNTGAGTGQTLRVGGATTFAGSGFQPVFRGTLAPGHKMWVRRTNSAGVLTPYAGTNPQLSVAGTAVNPITTEGYNLVRGDGGIAVLNQSGWPFLVSNNFNIVKNLQVSPVSGTQVALHLTASGCHIENVICDPGTSNAAAFLQDGGTTNNVVRRVWAKGPSAAGGGSVCGDLSGTGCLYEYCEFSGSAAQGGVRFNNATVFRGCLFRDNALDGVIQNAQVDAQFVGCIFWNNGRDGLRLTNSTQGLMGIAVENAMFGLNAGYDLNYTPADVSTNPGAVEWAKSQLRCNWFLTTGLARYHQLPAGGDDQALTVNPFVSSAAGNFTLNTLAGGGAAISGSPCTAAFPDGLNSASNIAGFYGIVPTVAPSDVVTMRSLWRELTNERDTARPTDSVVDIYLDWGIQEINRRVHYHYVTDATSVTLIAGQQEYVLPVDTIEVVWVQYSGQRLLDKGDVEQWRRLNEDWRNEPLGEPQFWAHYGANMVIRPAPSAEAVATAANLTLRRKNTPPSVTTNGAEQLPTEAWRLVVMYGAFLWSSCYPDSVVATQRAQTLKAEFEAGVAVMIEQYARRGIAL